MQLSREGQVILAYARMTWLLCLLRLEQAQILMKVGVSALRSAAIRLQIGGLKARWAATELKWGVQDRARSWLLARLREPGNLEAWERGATLRRRLLGQMESAEEAAQREALREKVRGPE